MTEPQPDALEDERSKLFVTDAEMIRRIGAPQDAARAMIKKLDRDRQSGFPQKQEEWGKRRYWPAVVAWFDHKYAFVEPRSIWDD